MPKCDASAPVRKGKRAEPANPKPPIQPMEPVSSQGGIRREDSFMRMGYIGPKTKPTNETAMAPPTREGTSQTMSSKLVHECQQIVGRVIQPVRCLPNRQCDVYKNHEALPDLR